MTQSPPFQLAADTRRGPRATNQDRAIARSLGSDPGTPCLVAATADGVGGHVDGGEASTEVLRQLVAVLTSHPALAANPAALSRAVSGISRGIASGLSTLAAVVILGDDATVVTVGDSRVYRLGLSGWKRVSVDHTVLEEARSRGAVPRGAGGASGVPRSIPWTNMLTRVMGGGAGVRADILGPIPHADDVWLVVTDGVWGPLADKGVAERCRKAASAGEAVAHLLDDALDEGGTDNVGAAIVAPSRWPFPLDPAARGRS